MCQLAYSNTMSFCQVTHAALYFCTLEGAKRDLCSECRRAAFTVLLQVQMLSVISADNSVEHPALPGCY